LKILEIKDIKDPVNVPSAFDGLPAKNIFPTVMCSIRCRAV